MGALKYVLPSGDLAATSGTVISVNTGTEDPTYPAANLGNKIPSKPAKLTTTTGRWVFDLLSAKTIELVALINTNLTGGLANVNVEANATDSWGAPTLSENFTIPTPDLDGRALNPFIDLSAVSPNTFRFWSIEIGTANGAPIAIGEVILGDSLKTFGNASFLMGTPSDKEIHPIVEARTFAGLSQIYQIGSRWRMIEGEYRVTVAADVTALRTLQRDARGRAEQFLLVPDLALNDAWWVRLFESELSRLQGENDTHDWTFQFEEVSVGVIL